MKKILKITGMLVAVAMIATGCADGNHTEDDPVAGIAPANPTVMSFTADKESIKAGEAVTFSWKVANADTVEVSGLSNDGTFDFASEPMAELESSVVVSDITSTTTFVLTATKKVVDSESDSDDDVIEGTVITKLSISRAEGLDEEGEAGEETEVEDASAEQTLTDTAEITITVSAADVSVNIASDSDVLNSGEKTIIRWEVNPVEDMTVEVVADSGEAIVAKEAMDCTDSIEAVEAAAAAETVPTIGCAVVAPTADTTYAVNATSSDGAVNSGSTTVTIATSKLSVTSFNFEDGSTDIEVTPGDVVKIAWVVEPSDATVEITLDGASCTMPETLFAEGEATCTITDDASFELLATLDGESASSTINAKTALGTEAKVIEVTAPSWAFQNEEVSITITALVPSAISSLKVNGTELSVGSEPVTMDVVASSTGVVVEQVLLNGSTKATTYTQAIAAAVDNFNSGTISSIDIIDGDIYYGLDKGYDEISKTVNSTVVKRTADANSAFVLPLKDLLVETIGAGVVNDYFFEEVVSLYPVGGVAVSGDRMVIGMAGLVVNTDATATDNKVIQRLLHTGKNYKGNHVSCKHTKQTGTKDGQVHSLINICDVAVATDGKIFMATDHGALWVESLEATALLGAKKATNITYGMIVNDMLDVDGILYAAATPGEWNEAGGVFKFNGETWEVVSEVPAYSLANDGSTIYAGTEEGVMMLSGGSVPGISGSVMALAAADGVVIAGTENGAFVLRDGRWNVITSLKDKPVTEAALVKDGGNVVVAIGSEASYMEGRKNMIMIHPVLIPIVQAEPVE